MSPVAERKQPPSALGQRLEALRTVLSADSSLDRMVTEGPGQDPGTTNLDHAMDFAMELGRALLGYGLQAGRLELELGGVADALGMRAEIYSTPTALIVTLDDGKRFLTRMVRVEPGSVDLERLGALAELSKRVATKKLGAQEAARRARAIIERPARYSRPLTVLAYGLTSAASAVLLGGSAFDVAVSAVLGAVVGIASDFATQIDALQRLFPIVAATVVAALAGLARAAGAPLELAVVLLAGPIVLVPGLTATTAALELATGHMVSGTARGASAFVTFLMLGFGIALGYRLMAFFPETGADPAPPLASWAVVPAAIAAAVAYTIVLRARPKDVLWFVAVCGTALGGASLGRELLGPELGAFSGALVVAIFSHVVARIRGTPVLTTLTPGILLLVPGGLGFLSVRQMLDHDVVSALETASRMLLVIMAIVAGVLVAHLAVPPKRPL
jgi:uncharacterized membrane protein YjjP (DUF1212 family)